MSGGLVIVLAVEALLVGLSSLLLIRPKFLFQDVVSQKKNRLILTLGLLLLAVTFLWSILLGIFMSAQT